MVAARAASTHRCLSNESGWCMRAGPSADPGMTFRSSHQVLFYGLMRQKRQEADDRLPVYMAPSGSTAGGGGPAGRDHKW